MEYITSPSERYAITRAKPVPGHLVLYIYIYQFGVYNIICDTIKEIIKLYNCIIYVFYI